MHVHKVWTASSINVKLLWISAFVRLFSYGLTNQILTLFLKEVGINEAQMGWFMSLTLIGDVFISYFLTWYADRLGRRLVLIYGAAMMVMSGVVFSISESYIVLLIFAVIGVISPSSDEVGPFKSIEESIMAHLTSHRERPEVYSMHSLLGTLGGALGSVACGLLVYVLKSYVGIEQDLQCYKVVFMFYTILALLKLITMAFLSETIDENHKDVCPSLSDEEVEDQDENSELLPRTKSHGLSKGTISVLVRLLIFFMLDSLGSGFMTGSWTVYYYSNIYGMTALSLGFVFFVTRLSMAVSNIPSAMVARRLGPVRATLLVQITSGLFSIMIPFAEPHLALSLVFLNAFSFTTSMDVTPRQILLTNVIKPHDLTRVMGIVNIGKTFARCFGPIFTGVLADKGMLWTCFVISGALVILADIILGLSFYGIDAQVLKKMNT